MSFSFAVKTLSGICVLYHNDNHNHALVQEYVYRVYIYMHVLSSLAYNSYTGQRACEPDLVYM